MDHIDRIRRTRNVLGNKRCCRKYDHRYHIINNSHGFMNKKCAKCGRTEDNHEMRHQLVDQEPPKADDRPWEEEPKKAQVCSECQFEDGSHSQECSLHVEKQWNQVNK